MQFKGLPEMDQAQVPADTMVQGSNVYTPAETLLLHWLTFHFNKARSPSPPFSSLLFPSLN